MARPWAIPYTNCPWQEIGWVPFDADGMEDVKNARVRTVNDPWPGFASVPDLNRLIPISERRLVSDHVGQKRNHAGGPATQTNIVPKPIRALGRNAAFQQILDGATQVLRRSSLRMTFTAHESPRRATRAMAPAKIE